MRERTKDIISPEPFPECPDCDSSQCTIRDEDHTTQYGKGDDATEVTYRIPVCICDVCGCRWTGPEAEEIRHNAICRALGRLTPEEVRAIRDQYGMSQLDFSELTGLGEASLSRWETGSQIQNAACDRLLRLLGADPRNVVRLQQAMNEPKTTVGNRFRVIEITPDLRQRQSRFQLRRAG